MSFLTCGRFDIDLSEPRIMAIINLTDDSFSGDGLRGDVWAALARAEQALADGAEILDLGAESTRPGCDPVAEEVEIARIVAAVEALHPLDVPLSIDTLKPGVMRAALAAGADMINDINGLRAPGAVDAVAASRCGLCVMHMQGEPRTMQHRPHYDDVLAEVSAFFDERLRALDAAGVERGRIVLDPGFGFGKTLEHNLLLLSRLDETTCEGLPILAGMSRKSMLGEIIGRPVDQRLIASVAAALIAAERGARILRVHDVAETRDALSVWQAVAAARANC
ncbi:dihydropteroate synthase [Betaproteobacteria bacterium]|nr:dihydropteroate synthase [Betaproteobacteria bacterium]